MSSVSGGLRRDDLAVLSQRNASERHQLRVRLERLNRRRAALFEEATHAASSLQRSYARKIVQLDREIESKLQLLDILKLQSSLIANLLYAQEQSQARQHGVLEQADWEVALSSLKAWQGEEARMLEHLRKLDALLHPSLPSGRTASRGGAAAPDKEILQVELGLVVDVPDGDGLTLEDGRRVRYIGIDAPELAHWGQPSEPFADRAAEYNRSLVVGKRVRLVKDISEVDRYGRLLRYVYLGDRLVNEELVKAGLARAFIVWPDDACSERMLNLEKAAARKGIGIWSSV